MNRSLKYAAAIVDAFTDAPYSGNPAGVVLLGGDPFPEDAVCIRAAAELRFPETAFVRQLSQTEYALRYFTPVCEAALCGHATVASFTLLRGKRLCGLGDMLVHTGSGDIRVTVEADRIMLDLAQTETKAVLDAESCAGLYRAFALTPRESVHGLIPKIVSAGLSDIMLPVESAEELDSAVMDEAAVREISRRLGVTGVHMFALSDPASDEGFIAHCRNFAPLYGIPEECATGTASGALFHYLSEYGLTGSSPVRFLQGEAMGRPSIVTACRETAVRVGGPGAVVMSGVIRL